MGSSFWKFLGRDGCLSILGTFMPLHDWSPQRLAEARLRGDEPVRRLVESMEQDPSLGPRGYNRLLRVMDWLMEAPELMAVADSPLESTVRRVPGAFLDFFDPQPLPDWVDEAKLARGAKLWEDNTLALLFVLYVASLPACYLLHRGIPALFRTGKLADRKYLPQRLFETGLMLDAVLDEDGLRSLEDHADRHEQLRAAALRQCGLAERWVWKGDALVRLDGTTGQPEKEEAEALIRALASLAGQIRGRRYVWGRGFLSARKVRFLHGYMRDLLLKAPPDSAGGAWDSAKLGAPVNQEDQAYTLLTFGYVMMVGLERLGRKLSRDDREAFLHRWRLVGHLMGIEDGLMTDRWDEAQRLFETIRDKEAGPSEEGRILTGTLLEFLEELLPGPASLSRLLPVAFVADQVRAIGGDPANLLTPELEARRRALAGRLAFRGILLLVRLHYGVRDLVGWMMPGVSGMVRSLMHPLAEELVASCWAGYARRPFYLPSNLTQWQLDPGADPAFRDRLRRWRRRLFQLILISAGLLVAGGFCVVAGLSMAFLQVWRGAAVGVGAGLASWWAFGELARWQIPALSHQRPRPEAPGGARPPQMSEQRKARPESV